MSPTQAILVIGVGNTLRGDDGLGPAVAATVAAQRWPHIQALAVPQLMPEMAPLLAAAQAAVFVDARHDSAFPPVTVQPLQPGGTAALPTHVSDPQSLLALAQTLYGTAPPAWLVTVAGADFGLRETLSPLAQDCARIAQERVETLLRFLACVSRG